MVKIRVWGVDSALKQEYEAMIDTGFTGFCKLPIMAALPLALTLRATANYSLANNSTVSMLLASGTVELDGMETQGLIVLDSAGDPLLGMEFLRSCDHFLFVSKHGVILVDETELAKAMAGANKVAKDAEAIIPAALPPDTQNPPKVSK
jgi:predicted aspartyl protease